MQKNGQYNTAFAADEIIVDNTWVKIYSTSAVYKAELLKGVLIENDIDAIVMNKKDSAYLFGEAEIYVKAEDAVKAKHILIQNETL